MLTGLFDLKYQKFLLNLKPQCLTSAETSKLNAHQLHGAGLQPRQRLFLVMPPRNQFYIGFYL